MIKDAILSSCGQYRYTLYRGWDLLKPMLVFVMLNPSTADAEVDDATIRRCIGFTKSLGGGSFHVVNLFAWRATKPVDLKRAADPVGADNDTFIRFMCYTLSPDAVILAWGTHGNYLNRDRSVYSMLRELGITPMCLAKTKAGDPSHPLMLPKDSTLIPYSRG